MDDAQAAKLRELAERARKAMAKYHADPNYLTGAAMVDDWINVAPLYNDAPDTILALLDTVDALRRERDNYRTDATTALVEYGTVRSERDAALALMRDFYEGRVDPTDAKWCNAVDALLGGGEADKN